MFKFDLIFSKKKAAHHELSFRKHDYGLSIINF